MLKRIFDIIFSLFVITLFLPIGLIIILILRLTGDGEIFYRQRRIGKNGQPFGIYKFATMVKDSPNIGAGDITLKDDPRVLPFGKFLRKTKLNEFPQFLNVVTGEMSLVGPRPLVENQYMMIPKDLQNEIKLLKPGITGIGSIIFRDEEKFLQNDNGNANEFYKIEIIPFKAGLECWYKKNRSLFIDTQLILITIFMVFFPNTRLHRFLFSELPKHEIFNPI